MKRCGRSGLASNVSQQRRASDVRGLRHRWTYRSLLDCPFPRTMTDGLNSVMVRAMTNEPFFTREGDAFIPTKVANGPWDPNSLHGRVIIGLLAFAIEQRHGAEGFVPA